MDPNYHHIGSTTTHFDNFKAPSFSELVKSINQQICNKESSSAPLPNPHHHSNSLPVTYPSSPISYSRNRTGSYDANYHEYPNSPNNKQSQLFNPLLRQPFDPKAKQRSHSSSKLPNINNNNPQYEVYGSRSSVAVSNNFNNYHISQAYSNNQPLLQNSFSAQSSPGGPVISSPSSSSSLMDYNTRLPPYTINPNNNNTNNNFDFQLVTPPASSSIPNSSSIHSSPASESPNKNIKKKEIKRRTRTGCLTCRKRRIKCDERKPHCFNCAKSKKECLGYEKLDNIVKKSK